MRLRLPLLVAVSILTFTSVAAALPPIPSMACPMISPDDAPKLDGEVNEAVWRKAEAQTTFHRYYGRLERPQEMRLLTDGQWLVKTPPGPAGLRRAKPL